VKKLLICNGTVVDPSQGIHTQMDILVEGERIAAVAKSIPLDRADEVIDAKGLHVFPGFIDIHVHLREPGNEGAETIKSGTWAAAKGGYTTIMAMPNTQPVCDTTTGVHYIVSRAAAEGYVNVIPIAAVTRGQQGEELTNFGALRDAGAGAFSDDGYPIMNADIMRRALEYTRMLNIPIFEHCEDNNLSGDGVMHEGRVSLELGLKGIPRVSESTAVARNVALAAHTGGHIHICHVSARESVQAIREAKRSGVRVTAEVSPHHLTMTDEAVRGYNTHAKMKPPLCAEEDRLALLEGLEDGTIDCIATDHAPHTPTSKNSVFDHAPFGIIGMEPAFPVLYTTFVATGRWTLDFLVERMTISPARVMSADWGTLEVGRKADIALVQLGTEYVFGLEHIGSKSRNCPWLGDKMLARIAGTIVSGDVRYKSEEVFGGAKQRKAPKASDTPTVVSNDSPVKAAPAKSGKKKAAPAKKKSTKKK